MSQSLLEIKDIHKSYMKNKKVLNHALRGISFAINAGEVFGLMGINGAGKTTLSGILAGLHPPSAGDVCYQGGSIYQSILAYRREVGFCPQRQNIDPSLTIAETLCFAARCYGFSPQEANQRKDELIASFGLEAYANSIATHLSGGYKQRFLLARTLMHKPRFVILDEPTVGLDVHIRQELWQIIRELRSQKMTVLLTTHYLEEVEALADRVCFIHRGQAKVVDTPTNLNKTYMQNSLEGVFLHLMKQADTEDL